MTDINAALGTETAPLRDSPRRERVLPALMAVSVLAGIAAALAVILDGRNGLLFVNLLALFAAGGVFTALAAACGLVHFGAKAPPHDLAHRFMGASRDGIAISDSDGAILFANKAFRDLTGQRDGPLPRIEKIIGGWSGSPERAFRLIRSARQKKGWSREFSTGLPDWPVQTLRISVVPLRNDTARGAGPLLAWHAADVTRERQKDAEAISRLSMYPKVVDEAELGLLAVQRNGTITFMNQRLASWLGLADTNAPRLNFIDFLSANGMGLMEKLDFSAPGSEVLGHDLDLIRQDGTAIPVRLFYKIVASPDDAEPKLVATVFNLETPVYKSAANDNAPELRFAKLFQSAPIAMGKVGRWGQLSMVNASLINLFGLRGEKRNPACISIADLVDETARPQLQTAIESAFAQKASIAPVSFALASDPNRTGRIFISPAAAGTYGGEPEAIIYGVDTSEQRALEEQIAQSQKMQAVGQLAGGVAHDFNNVLTAIIGFSDLLLARHRPADPAFKDIMNIKQNANRAAGLVRQLLAFSRRQTLRPRVLQMTDVLEDLAILLNRLLGEKVASQLVHGRDLWMIKADQNQLEQVVINLAVNARDAMAGGGKLTIRTANVSERESLKLNHTGLKHGEYVLCEVTDTGCGIPPENLEKIFEPFYTTKEVGKGTGLGLSTVYGIVKQTGGHITVDSQPGRGTTFRIYLPRHVETEAEKAAAITQKAADKKEKPRDLTGSGTVLLVEDEEAVRSFASRALATRGYKVVEAVSGVDALQVMSERGAEIDLVISDVVMPEMDGPALLHRLRAEHPGLKFIFMSGYAEEAFKGTINPDEQFAFLPKPFTLKQLAAAVKEAFSAST